VSRSVSDLLAVLDQFEVPDQWNEIVGLAGEPADASRLAASDASPSIVIETSEPTSRRREERAMSRKLVLGVAAAAVLVVVIALVLRPSDDDKPPAPVEQPAPTTTVTPSESTANADLSPMVEAYNAGRLDEYMAYFARTATFYGCCPWVEHRAASAAFMAANDQWTLTGCTRTTDANTVTCDSAHRDDFHGTGGLVLTEHLEFQFDTEGLITSYRPLDDDDTYADYHTFGQAFAAWLLDTHPDVSRNYGSFLYDIGPLSRMPTAAKVPTALEYVDEFVTQSGDYPVAT
jgi:hypothetical protein